MEKDSLLLINNILSLVIDKLVLYDISLQINAGAIYGIMGLGA